MERNIEKLLKLENGDQEKVNTILNHLKNILKETQSNERDKLHQKNALHTNRLLDTETSNVVNLRKITENNTDISDNGNQPLQEPSVAEFYDNTNVDTCSITKLKDIAENHILYSESDLSCLDVPILCTKLTADPSQVVKLKNIDENNKDLLVTHHVDCQDNNDIGNSSTLVSSTVDDVHFGINELLLIVQEYEELKDKYLTLETNVESKLTQKRTDQSSNNDVDKSVEKIKSLQLENQRLTNEIELLTNKNGEADKLHAAFENTIERLESALKSQKGEIAAAAEKLSAHDAAAKRAITVLQKEMGARVEQITKMYEGSVSEKDVYILKISKLEATIDNLKQSQSNQRKKLSDQETELEGIRNLLRVKESEDIKKSASNEQYEKEIAKLTKRFENHKEELESQDIKVKWAQNKLKNELESHKDTKKQVTVLTTKLQVAKEEGGQIRRDCQEMIGRYQGDEEINSVSLRKQLGEQANRQKEQENLYTKQDRDYQEQAKQLSLMIEDNRKFSRQLADQKKVVTSLEERNKTVANELSEKEKDCAEMKTLIDIQKEQIKELQEIEMQEKGHMAEIDDLQKYIEELKQQLDEYVIDAKEHKDKQHEISLYSQSLTENNVISKARLTEIQLKLNDTRVEKEELIEKFKQLEQELISQIESLTKDKTSLQTYLDELIMQIDQKSTTVNEISMELEETRNELKVMKKKNASQLKDLQKELQQTTRKIEQIESHSNGSIESLSNRSRTSSCNSLDKLHAPDSPSSTSPNYSSSPQLDQGVVIPLDHYVTQPNRGSGRSNGFQELEIDKKVLVERICKLQKLHAKKNEKIEFLEDHIIQLTDANQKKTRIIQHFLTRQEAGSVTSDKFDRNKANFSQHGGIMSSVYSARPTDKGMTLELSLTINHKLQAVLEDTVLKNIMLQENINTLGIEIAKFLEEGKPNS